MTEHVHGSGCINTYPDCDYPEVVVHTHDGLKHEHPATPGDRHLHREYDVWSPGNEPAVYGCTLGCGNDTDRPGQPCDPCDRELGVGA